MYTIIGVHKALDKRKEAIADRIIRHGIENGKACISFQVVKKCLNTMLRKAEILLTAEQTRSYLKTILRICFVYPPVSPVLTESRHPSTLSLRLYDALIIAAALSIGLYPTLQ